MLTLALKRRKLKKNGSQAWAVGEERRQHISLVPDTI